jgi:hypothetical protein
MEFISKMLQMTSSGYVVTPRTTEAIKTIDYNLRLKEKKITDILVAGIPMMVSVAADDTQISGRLFEESKKKDRSKTQHREYAVRDFLTVFGEKAPTMSEYITAETGASKGDIYNVMGLFLPIFLDAIEEENPQDDKALAELFRADADEARIEVH